eukprot:6205435-Pleurochrysis_carterae.AAC.2
MIGTPLASTTTIAADATFTTTSATFTTTRHFHYHVRHQYYHTTITTSAFSFPFATLTTAITKFTTGTKASVHLHGFATSDVRAHRVVEPLRSNAEQHKRELEKHKREYEKHEREYLTQTCARSWRLESSTQVDSAKACVERSTRAAQTRRALSRPPTTSRAITKRRA